MTATMTNVKPTTKQRKLSPEEIKKERERDHQVVKGIFRCFEPRGGSVTFVFRKYKGDPVEKYSFTDDHTYEIPMMVAKHLNQHCWYPKHTHVLDANGNPSVQVGKKVKRFAFESFEFHEEE